MATLFISSLTFIFFLYFFTIPVFAQTTLKSQIDLIDDQTNSISSQIDETNRISQTLQDQIANLSKQLEQTKKSLDQTSEQLLQTIIQTYKYNNTISFVNLLFSKNGFGRFLERLKYTQLVQSYKRKKLAEVLNIRQTFNKQRKEKLQEENKFKNLNIDLQNFQSKLREQKRLKEALLAITQNDEARYQIIVSELKEDSSSIGRAISNIGPKIGEFKTGQTIGYEGLTGCTGGPHLHFEVYQKAKVKNQTLVDTENEKAIFLDSDTSRIWSYLINPHKLLDSQIIGPPIQGFPSSTFISTEFGNLYALGKHTGLDIYDDAYTGTPLLAVFDGDLYSLNDQGCDVPGFDHENSKGLILDNGKGTVALYWHIL